MNSITIRKIDTTDIDALKKIGKQTFLETFEDSNTAEDMELYLNQNFSTQQISKELGNHNSAFYFAESEDKTLGYLKVNWSDAQTEFHDKNALEIERIYVLKQFHGKKVGQLLYKKALEIANNKKSKYIWLGVWEHNIKAIGFYQKNGFVVFDTHVFIVGEDEQTDYLMKRVL